MNKFIEKIVKYPVLITVLTCVLFFFLPFKPKPFGDGEYHEGTIDLIEFFLNNFEGSVRVDKGLFTLFYYLIPYSAVHYFKSNALYFLAGAIFNCIATCVAMRYLFKAFQILNFTTKTKMIVLILLSLFPIHIYYAFGVLAESAAFMMVSVLLYFWVKTVYTNKFNSNNLFILALINVAIVGIRPNLLPFAIAFLFIIVIAGFNYRSKLIYFSTFICVFFLLLSAEKELSNNDGEFKKVVFRQQILWSRFELRDEPFNWLPQHGQDEFASTDYLNNLKKRAELDSLAKANNLDPTTYYLKWVVNDVIENPLLTIRQYVFKFFQGQSFIITPLMKSNKNAILKYGIHIFINIINYILVFSSLMGLYYLRKSGQILLMLPLLFLWGWSLLYIFIFHSEQRYMFPVRPVLFFLSAYFFNYLRKVD